MLGATSLAAEYAVKKYCSHQTVRQKDLDEAESERKAKEEKRTKGFV